jgi:hypothetical protein
MTTWVRERGHLVWHAARPGGLKYRNARSVAPSEAYCYCGRILHAAKGKPLESRTGGHWQPEIRDTCVQGCASSLR